MDRSNFCGCKGVRTCILCENKFGLQENKILLNKFKENNMKSFVFCTLCSKLFEGWDATTLFRHPHDQNPVLGIFGVFVQPDFITEDEETKLIKYLDSIPWDSSQSGRRKQNFGPKCNFKKKKLQVGSFSGFPAATEFVQKRFNEVQLLHNFQTVEQCSLEYDPNRGASIDPHIDDCWVWGERVVSVNLLADAVLTLTRYKGDDDKYNLTEAQNVPSRICEDIVVRVPMPRRSLVVLYSDARYNWEHCVLREDVKERRICLAYREFTDKYLEGGEREVEVRKANLLLKGDVDLALTDQKSTLPRPSMDVVDKTLQNKITAINQFLNSETS